MFFKFLLVSTSMFACIKRAHIEEEQQPHNNNNSSNMKKNKENNKNKNIKKKKKKICTVLSSTWCKVVVPASLSKVS